MKNTLEKLKLLRSQNKKLVLLLDPDKTPLDIAIKNVQTLQENGGAAVLIGSSILVQSDFDAYVKMLVEIATIPVIIFPGDGTQISSSADAMLLLSLISGRNADYLIGKHVENAFALKNSGLEIIPTGYILVDGGNITSVQYVTQTIPIPNGKADLAAATALAAELLGMHSVYLEAGSGAKIPVDVKMIEAIKKHTQHLIWVGGGLRNAEQIKQAIDAGADFVVIGTAVEENSNALLKLLEALK